MLTKGEWFIGMTVIRYVRWYTKVCEDMKAVGTWERLAAAKSGFDARFLHQLQMEVEDGTRC